MLSGHDAPSCLSCLSTVTFQALANSFSGLKGQKAKPTEHLDQLAKSPVPTCESLASTANSDASDRDVCDLNRYSDPETDAESIEAPQTFVNEEVMTEARLTKVQNATDSYMEVYVCKPMTQHDKLEDQIKERIEESRQASTNLAVQIENLKEEASTMQHEPINQQAALIEDHKKDALDLKAKIQINHAMTVRSTEGENSLAPDEWASAEWVDLTQKEKTWLCNVQDIAKVDRKSIPSEVASLDVAPTEASGTEVGPSVLATEAARVDTNENQNVKLDNVEGKFETSTNTPAVKIASMVRMTAVRTQEIIAGNNAYYQYVTTHSKARPVSAKRRRRAVPDGPVNEVEAQKVHPKRLWRAKRSGSNQHADDGQPYIEEKAQDDVKINLVPPESMHCLGYSWIDDGENVKVLAPSLKELEALKVLQALRGLEISGVDVQFGHKQLRIVMRPPGGGAFGLMLQLYGAIDPKESTFRLSAGKRLTVTLRKTTIGAWPQLIE